MPYQNKYRIVSNSEVSPGNFSMTIHAPQIARNAKPGQFIELGINSASGLILRRPLSIHRVKKEVIEVICQVIGKGTQALSVKKSGSLIDIIGPLGNGFDLQKGKEQKIVLVAGGMGVAPLVFLAEKLMEILNPKSEILIFIGAKTKKLLLCEDEFKKLGCDVKIATDDGSKGHKGFITDLLNPYHLALTTIYACGPHAMLKQVARIAAQHKIPAQVSLEERMACGFGACLGCAVKMKDERYKMVCKDGPVFNASEVAW